MKRVFPAGRPCPVQSVSFTLPAGTTACGYPVNDVGAYPGVDGSRAVHRRQPECRCTGHRRVGCPGYIAGARYRCEWKRRPSVWPYTLHLCCKRWRHHTRKKVHPITRCVTGQPIDACHGVIRTIAPCCCIPATQRSMPSSALPCAQRPSAPVCRPSAPPVGSSASK